jgi:phage anti-repressor protein
VCTTKIVDCARLGKCVALKVARTTRQATNARDLSWFLQPQQQWDEVIGSWASGDEVSRTTRQATNARDLSWFLQPR